ncbi:MAG: hypothetical protein IJJ25_00260 [Lachnospiraceae bacterium]|nr:hypothetical protein [Lachnospiraceae bacterium]MBQ6482750.1 hypothetical protein [Anaerolineaceae bacterium]
MSIVLYSTGCPKCNVLETKLNNKNIKFDVVTDEEVMQNKGFMSLPMLEVNGEELDFMQALRWTNEQ